MTVDQHPAFQVQRRDLAFEDVARLCRVASSTAAIETRSIAAWYAMGVQSWLNSHLHSRVGSPTAFFDRLCEDGHPQTLVEVAREGHRRGAGMLAPLLVLLHRSQHDGKMHEGDDALQPERICGEVPSWCLDIYSRDGRSALERFIRSNAETACWIKGNVRPSAQVRFLGDVIFRVEGGLLRRRRSSELTRELRQRMEAIPSSRLQKSCEVLDLARQEISLLNEVRHGL